MSPPLAPYRLPHDASDSVLGSLGPHSNWPEAWAERPGGCSRS
ncbi:hypothetical protein [Streptomyces sp. NPDC001100]